MNKELFKEELHHIQREIQIIEELDKVNSHLQQYNWVFLHPYSQGGDIDVLRKMISESENPDDEIISFFARKFFDLRWTTHLIEGFYNVRPYLRDYTPVIRESVVLCLQKDFRGAISTLIPVIEGTLRKCLIDKKGDHKKSEININELLKVINILTDEYVNLQKEYLTEKYDQYIQHGMYMDRNQEDEILIKHRRYFELWMKQLTNFLENKLYLNTKHNEVSDTFNRHLIFHGMESNIEYSLSNFLRIFNSLDFLSWAIGNTTRGSSVFSVAEENEVEKIKRDYLKILIASEALTETKSKILGPIESFKKYIDPKFYNRIQKPIYRFKKVVDRNNRFFK